MDRTCRVCVAEFTDDTTPELLALNEFPNVDWNICGDCVTDTVLEAETLPPLTLSNPTPPQHAPSALTAMQYAAVNNAWIALSQAGQFFRPSSPQFKELLEIRKKITSFLDRNKLVKLVESH